MDKKFDKNNKINDFNILKDYNPPKIIDLNEDGNMIENNKEKSIINKEKNEISNSSIEFKLIKEDKSKLKEILNENKKNTNNFFNININTENNLLTDIIENKNDFNFIGKKISAFKNIKNCKICLDDFDENDIMNYELECGCIIHYTCFDEYIKNSVENNNIPILCPYCKIEIHPNLIYDSLHTNGHQDLIQKYEKFSMDNYLLNHKDNYSCCPTAGCEYIFFFLEGENRFLCPLCQKEYCLSCKDIWHKGMTCNEYLDSKDVKKCDEKFLKFVQGANYKICPKCGVWVEKTKGCNHMKCRCGNHFCYKCGKTIPRKIHDCPCWFEKK